MADLFTEADEALKQERLARLWREYGIYVVIFVIGTIVMTGALSAYSAWDKSVRQNQTATLIALQNAESYPENVLSLEKPDLRPGLRGILYLNAAGTLIQSGDTENALSLYQRLSNDKSVKSELRDLGTLMAVRLQIDAQTSDTQSLLDALKTVYKSKSIWGPHAHLEAAVIEARKNNNFEAAQTHLNFITDTDGLPEGLYQKAQALGHIYRLEAQTQTNAGEAAQ